MISHMAESVKCHKLPTLETSGMDHNRLLLPARRERAEAIIAEADHAKKCFLVLAELSGMFADLQKTDPIQLASKIDEVCAKFNFQKFDNGFEHIRKFNEQIRNLDIIQELIRRGQSTRSELERKALHDYEDYVGEVLIVNLINGFTGHPDSGDSTEWELKTPVRVRVTNTDQRDITRWNNEFIDPIWNVELVEPSEELKNGRNFWVHGISYSINGEVQPTSTWRPENE